MLRVITLNINGIRKSVEKGFFTWLDKQDADVVCLQETKAQREQLSDAIFHPPGYDCYYVDAQKKGYAGVALYTRHKADKVITQLGYEMADVEGRYVQIDIGSLSIASLYLPSGSSGEHRQAIKFAFLDWYGPKLAAQRVENRNYILCGDWNIAHKRIDLTNDKANEKHSGFLPEERAWMDTLLDKIGYVDAFRVHNTSPEQYTWWSNRGRAWAKNVGWRIDYQIVTPELKDAVKDVAIYKEERFSDHAPLTVDYAITL